MSTAWAQNTYEKSMKTWSDKYYVRAMRTRGKTGHTAAKCLEKKTDSMNTTVIWNNNNEEGKSRHQPIAKIDWEVKKLLRRMSEGANIGIYHCVSALEIMIDKKTRRSTYALTTVRTLAKHIYRNCKALVVISSFGFRWLKWFQNRGYTERET